MADAVLHWDKNVPPDLIPAVEHIRKSFSDDDRKCRWTTQAWCHAALHPDQQDKIAKAQDYISALNIIKAIIHPSALLLFQDLVRENTPSAILEAFFSMYKWALIVTLKRSFKDLLEIAYAHADRISSTPMEWAVWHSNAIVDSAAYMTAGWLKHCCDVQPSIPNDNSDENWEWLKWQAPRFVMMRPSLGVPYDASRAWERADIQSSLRLAHTFKKNFVISLKSAVKDCAGEAHLEFAKQSRPLQDGLGKDASHDKSNSMGTDSVREAASKQGFSVSDDFRSVFYQGKTHPLTPAQGHMMEVLWKAHLSGHPVVSKDKLLSAAERDTSQVRDTWRGSKLWTTLIVTTETKGTYRLNISQGEGDATAR